MYLIKKNVFFFFWGDIKNYDNRENLKFKGDLNLNLNSNLNSI